MRLLYVFLINLLTVIHLNFLQAVPFKPINASIVMNADTGYIYESHNCHELTYPASLTKMMTLYLVFEALEAKRIKLTTRMPVSYLATTQMPSKLGLRTNQTLTVLDGIMSLVTKSANDASVVIAEYLGGSVEQFAQIMTQKAHYLKMKDTVFRNPNGVPNKAQRTTAHDMAKLAQALYKRFPNYYQYFRTKSFIYQGQLHKNHNKLLGICPGVDGVKTGYIAASGFNLAASAKRSGVRLIAVVMGGRTAQSRDREIVQLLNKNFQVALGQSVPAQTVQLISDQQLDKDKNLEVKRELNAFDELVDIAQPIKPIPKKQVLTEKLSSSKVDSKNKYPVKKLIKREGIYEVHIGRYTHVTLAKKSAKILQKKYNALGAKVLVVSNKQKKQKHYHIYIKNLTQTQAVKMCQDKTLTGFKCKIIKST